MVPLWLGAGALLKELNNNTGGKEKSLQDASVNVFYGFSPLLFPDISHHGSCADFTVIQGVTTPGYRELSKHDGSSRSKDDC